MNPFLVLADAVAAEQAACFVRVAHSEGSAPRDAGAWMVVRPSRQFHGTIGGGALEWNALTHAHLRLQTQQTHMERQTIALGPGLGQCCGGRVVLQFENFTEADIQTLRSLADESPYGFIAWSDGNGRVGRRAAAMTEQPQPPQWLEKFEPRSTPVLLFGAGHVARALVLALAPLPFAVRWIETRANSFPGAVPKNVQCLLSEAPQRELQNAPQGSFVVVMTHSHALDLDIVAAALQAPELRMRE